jgi:hypothetical protein
MSGTHRQRRDLPEKSANDAIRMNMRCCGLGGIRNTEDDFRLSHPASRAAALLLQATPS